jgi:hypothetical protein
LCYRPENGNSAQREAAAILKNVQQKYDSLASYSESGQEVLNVPGTNFITTYTTILQRPNHYRVEWEAPNQPGGGAAWSAGQGDFLFMNDKYYRMANAQAALSGASGIAGSMSAFIPMIFFHYSLGTAWGNSVRFLLSSTNLVRQADERISNVDCYVLTINDFYHDTKVRLWIGKSDYLIHQSQSSFRHFPNTTHEQFSTSTESHERIAENPPLKPSDFDHEIPTGVAPSETFP